MVSSHILFNSNNKLLIVIFIQVNLDAGVCAGDTDVYQGSGRPFIASHQIAIISELNHRNCITIQYYNNTRPENNNMSPSILLKNIQWE